MKKIMTLSFMSMIAYTTYKLLMDKMLLMNHQNKTIALYGVRHG